MERKQIKITKATEKERKAYCRGFKAGVEMCLERINSVMETANFNLEIAEVGAVLVTDVELPHVRGEE